PHFWHENARNLGITSQNMLKNDFCTQPVYSLSNYEFDIVRGFVNPRNERGVIISSWMKNWNTVSHELGHVFGLADIELKDEPNAALVLARRGRIHC
ncbi:MAG: zinc-dependent metalloprotease, partial [Planctomycetaceae bacterium]|nr:zinc-dependent metalloprotease [Planctomycetaceae bacterium]